MSKYAPLWQYIQQHGNEKSLLSFAEIRTILGFEIDHSFLNYKKELVDYGYEVEKISLKEKTVRYRKR